MIYIKRDGGGAVVAISKDPISGFEASEEMPSSEVDDFLVTVAGSEFQASDLSFIRVLDDVIDLLISKNVILFTELPPVVQEKYTERATMRERRRDALNLLEDGDIL